MRIELEWIDDLDGGITELESYLRQDPRLDDVHIQRGQPVVPAGHQGVLEILEFVASNVGLGLVVNGVYDFLRARLERGTPEEQLKVRLVRTDLSDGTRSVAVEVTGSAEAAERIVRAALDD